MTVERALERPVAVVPPALVLLAATMLGSCAQRPVEPAAEADPPVPAARPEPAAEPAEPPALRPDHAERYVVKPGDTLWGIADRFLVRPWRWPEIWHENPDIPNPHLIYPGDVLVLVPGAGVPRIQLALGRPTVKLSPQVRVESVHEPISTLPREAIQPFLQRSRVVTEAEWLAAPYLVGHTEDRVVFATADRVYARGFTGPYSERYRIYRLGDRYVDPESKEPLGYDLRYAGEAALVAEGDPATLVIASAEREALAGDRLFPVEEGAEDFLFEPRSAPPGVQGRILSVIDGVSLIGQYHTVVLNLGTAHGVGAGHVFGTYQAGRVVADPLTEEPVRLPDERSGLAVVYRAFDRLSYALIVEATRTIRVADRVGAP